MQCTSFEVGNISKSWKLLKDILLDAPRLTMWRERGKTVILATKTSRLEGDLNRTTEVKYLRLNIKGNLIATHEVQIEIGAN